MNRFLIVVFTLMASISPAHAGLALASESAAQVSQAFQSGGSGLELSAWVFGAVVIIIPIIVIWWALKSLKSPKK